MITVILVHRTSPGTLRHNNNLTYKEGIWYICKEIAHIYMEKLFQKIFTHKMVVSIPISLSVSMKHKWMSVWKAVYCTHLPQPMTPRPAPALQELPALWFRCFWWNVPFLCGRSGWFPSIIVMPDFYKFPPLLPHSQWNKLTPPTGLLPLLITFCEYQFTVVMYYTSLLMWVSKWSKIYMLNICSAPGKEWCMQRLLEWKVIWLHEDHPNHALLFRIIFIYLFLST